MDIQSNYDKSKNKKVVLLNDDKYTIYNESSDEELDKADPYSSNNNKSAKSIRVKTQKSLTKKSSFSKRQSILNNILAAAANHHKKKNSTLSSKHKAE